MQIETAHFSQPGPKGVNEDAVLLPLKVCGCIWTAIADGLGGHEGGGTASRAALEAVNEYVHEYPKGDLEPLFAQAQERLRQIARGDTTLSQMATTLSVLKIDGNEAQVGHVGDTRIYHLRGKGIVTRTKDQTEVQRLVDLGVLRPPQARRYNRRNVLLSVLSPERQFEIYEERFQVVTGDRVLLLSDGVYEKIFRRELSDLSLDTSSSKQLCDSIQDKIAARGLSDDSTVICVTFV